MIKPEDLEASDRHFVEQVMLSIRMLRGEIGQGDGGDARMQRAYALVLMREALGVLDSIRDTNCTPHLQMAIDRLMGGPRNDLSRERSEEHTSELQSLMRISYAVFCLKKKKT